MQRKPYQKPELLKRERLSVVAAIPPVLSLGIIN
jgi:hypothetical protein